MDLKEIVGAWFNVVVHSDVQRELAEKRFEICNSCPLKKEIFEKKEWSLVCGGCGCPIKAKVYTKKTYMDDKGSCPNNLWKEIEDDFIQKNRKTTKTLL